MSKLTIVDLNRTEELSSSTMGNITGGANCDAAEQIYENLFATGSALEDMGFYQGGSNLMSYGLGVAVDCHTKP